MKFKGDTLQYNIIFNIFNLKMYVINPLLPNFKENLNSSISNAIYLCL